MTNEHAGHYLSMRDKRSKCCAVQGEVGHMVTFPVYGVPTTDHSTPRYIRLKVVLQIHAILLFIHKFVQLRICRHNLH